MGFDDVILTCVVIANSKQILNVSLVDANTGDILQSQFGNYETLVMYYNLELQTGTMNHRCTVVTERGLVRQDTVSVRVRGLLLFTSYLILCVLFLSLQHTATQVGQQTTTILLPQTQPHSSGYLLLPRYACRISACSCLCCSVCLLLVP